MIECLIISDIRLQMLLGNVWEHATARNVKLFVLIQKCK